MLDFLRPYLLLLTLVFFAGFFAAGWTVRGWAADAAAAELREHAARDHDRMQAEIDEKSAAYEAERARTAVVNAERTNTIREIFRDAPPLDPDCAPPASLGRVLTQSVLDANGSTAPRQSGSTVPAALPTP